MLPIECGLFGICSQNMEKTDSYDGDNTNIIFNSLSKLQHRGQDSYGYSYIKEDTMITKKHLGLVNLTKIEENADLNQISNLALIGHLRYVTSGKSSINEADNIQPFTGKITDYNFSLAHNGNIKNTESLERTLLKLNPDVPKPELEQLKQRNHDSFYLLKILENLPAVEMEDKLVQLVNTVPGVYCLLVMVGDTIYIVRDRFGVRPLCLATIEINNQTQYMVASESVSFPAGSYLERDVKPGEVIKMSIHDGFETIYQMNTPEPKHCLFEYIYFLRPETIADELSVSDIRHKYGELLAQKEKDISSAMISYEESPVVNEDKNICINNVIDYERNDDYVVVGSPSSGIIAAKGYAGKMGLNYDQIIIKQKNIRSFILNSDEARKKACYEKFKFDKDKINGKKIVLVDDSLVRGNTTRIMIQILKELGALEVHVRIASPPIKHACYFGIDIPDDKELIAAQNQIKEVTSIIGADSLIYLDLSDIQKVHKNTMCHACFSGEYEKELMDW